MQITQEAKCFLASLRKYLPNAQTMTYELTVENEVIQLIPTQNKKFTDYICDGDWVLAGIAADTDLKLIGRTIQLNPRHWAPKLELKDRRRSARIAFSPDGRACA